MRKMTGSKDEFNPLVFEKKLTQLKDTQDSIQSLSAWCLQHRQQHKKIVASWLNVLKRAKIEQRLTLFYLANDVIQYSKRKNYEFVESWGTTLQKATPLVRDEKVKHKILRIFKIWEERNVYDEEFLTDLTGLLSAAAGKPADSDPSEFQAIQLVNKIKQCSVLETDTDLQLKKIHDSSLSFKDIDQLCVSLKERHDAEEAAQEVEEGVVRLEGYVRALQKELVARATLCHLLHTALQYYGIQRGEVKVVANAYRNFGGRVRNLKRRLDELCETLPSSNQNTSNKVKNAPEKTSPVPSPPLSGESVPSPGPDEDFDLPQDSGEDGYNVDKTFSSSLIGDEMGKGFASFLGNGDFPFFSNKDKKDSNAGSKMEVISSHPQSASDDDFNMNDFLKSLIQPKPGTTNPLTDTFFKSGNKLTPPPPPPMLPGLDLLNPGTTPVTGVPPPPPPPPLNNFYGSKTVATEPVAVVPPPVEQYPEQGSHWTANTWENPPESPPHADAVSNINVPPLTVYSEPPPTARVDIDHRSLKHISQPPPQHNPILEADDVDHRVLPTPMTHPQPNPPDRNRPHQGDVDHRNLISLTGSLPPPPPMPSIIMGSWSPHRQTADQDYRNISSGEIQMIPPPPLPPLQLRPPLLGDSPPAPKMAKTMPSTPPVISSLPPNMPSHPPDMSMLPPAIVDVTKLPPHIGGHQRVIQQSPHAMPNMSQLPPVILGHSQGYPGDLSQVPLPPNIQMQQNMRIPPPMHHPNMNMSSMPGHGQYSNREPSMGTGVVGVSHLPPSSMLKHPPEVLNQNHRINAPHHHHNSMMNPAAPSGGPMLGRPARSDNVESIDMEMSEEEDEYDHLENAMSLMHSTPNSRSVGNNNKVLVGGDTSYKSSSYNKPNHPPPMKTDMRSNLVRINSVSDEEMKKEEMSIRNTSNQKPVNEISTTCSDNNPIKNISDDFILSENLLSDDDDFFNEITNFNEEDKDSKSPDIFDEVLLSSSNPENPNIKGITKEPILPTPPEKVETEEAEESESFKDEPVRWTERVGAMNPSRPAYQPRMPFQPRGGMPNRFRHPHGGFHRPRGPYPNDFFRGGMRRPWGPRPSRPYW